MEDICEVCQKSAEITCSCDTSVRYCSKDYVFVHKLSRENHIPIELSKRRQEIYQKFISTIKTLNEVKFQIINTLLILQAYRVLAPGGRAAFSVWGR